MMKGSAMRQLILDKIKAMIDDGDDEIEDNYGDFATIEKMSDEEVLDIFEFAVGFRG